MYSELFPNPPTPCPPEAPLIVLGRRLPVPLSASAHQLVLLQFEGDVADCCVLQVPDVAVTVAFVPTGILHY